MFSLAIPAWNIAARTAVVYVALLLGMRLTGKREVGQMSLFDLVLLLLLANAVQNAMVGPDSSLVGGLLAAAVLLSFNAIVARLAFRSPRLRHLIVGTPTLLATNGTFIPQHLKREGIDEEFVLAALREHGLNDISQVAMAVLETDGSISIVPQGTAVKHSHRPHTRII